MVARGLLKGVVAEPPGCHCAACDVARAKRTSLGRSKRATPLDVDSLRPQRDAGSGNLWVEPLNAGDRNGRHLRSILASGFCADSFPCLIPTAN